MKPNSRTPTTADPKDTTCTAQEGRTVATQSNHLVLSNTSRPSLRRLYLRTRHRHQPVRISKLLSLLISHQCPQSTLTQSPLSTSLFSGKWIIGDRLKPHLPRAPTSCPSETGLRRRRSPSLPLRQKPNQLHLLPPRQSPARRWAPPPKSPNATVWTPA